MSPRARLEVVAVESDRAQITWAWAAGDVVVDGRVVAHADARAGSIEVDGLSPNSSFEVVCGSQRTSAKTLPTVAGGEAARIATISDLHIGERGFGYLPRMYEAHPIEPYPLRAVRAALQEATAWGAQLIVIKGDLAHLNLDEQYRALSPLIADCPVPVVVIAGNHDGGNHHHDDIAEGLQDANAEIVEEVNARVVGGLNVVILPSMAHHVSAGRVHHRLDDLANALDNDRPSLVLTHHHLQLVPWHIPVATWGVQRHRLVSTLLRSPSPVVLTAGHSHRNRHHRVHAAPRTSAISVTEVGSTKDFPGVWAGYIIGEKGLQQVVRRIAEPSVLEWTERCRSMLYGIWGRWALGALDDRCVDWRW
jgi:3',5'-cyclic-AMP phosphodiesterase